MRRPPKTRTAGPVSTLVLTLVVTVVVGVHAGTGAALAQQAGAGRDVGEIDVAARAWVLTDLESGEHLAGENASARLPMASTTKIMGSLVVLEKADLDEEVTVSEDAAAYATPAYSNVGLVAGDTLSVRELLMAALISSGDDAAYALAEHVGGGEDGVDRFVEQMNEEAKSRGLKDTHFENPVGFDEEGHHSSARDLAAMAHAAMQNPEFRDMVSTEYATIHTPYQRISLVNTNELLFSYGPATGIKTGTTPAAGESLVSSASMGDESFACVVLGAKEERFAASVRTLRHGFAAYDRRTLVLEGRPYATIDAPYRRDETVDLVAQGDVDGLVDGDPDVEREVELVDRPPLSARSGTMLGRVVVKVDGKVVGQTPLVAKEGYKKASLGQRVWYTVGGFLE